MSFAYVGQTSMGYTGGATSVPTGSKTWTAGNLAVVWVGGAGSATKYTARVTDAGGNTWFRASGDYSSGAGIQLEVWFSVIEAGFTGTVTAYFLSSMEASIQGFEYSFSGQCRMIDQAFKDLATSTTQTTNSVTPTSGANILLFQFLTEAVNHNYTEAAGWNQRIADGGENCVFDRSVDGASGSYSHTVTVNSGADNSYFTELVCFEEISGYPAVVDVNYKNGTSLSGGVALNMPPNISAGDLLLAFASNDAPGATTMAIDGWTAIFESADHSTVTCRHAAFAKIAAGSDTATLTGASQDYTAVVMRIENHGVSTISSDIKVSSYARSAGTASSTPNPPSLDAGSSKKWLWIASYGADDDDNNIAWCQQDYSGIREIKSAASTTSTQMGISFLLYEGQTLDPAAFTMNANEEWVAYTVAIPPQTAYTPHPYTGTGALLLDSDVTKSRGKNPTVSSSFSFDSGVVASLAKLYVFASDGVHVYDSGAVTHLTVQGAANTYEYAADAVLVYADGSVLSKGKAFISNGSICYVADPTFAKGRAFVSNSAVYYVANSVLAKGRAFVPSGSIYYVANPVLAKGKTPSVGGLIAFDAGALTERVKLWIYPGDGAQVYASDADVSSTSSVSRTYVGEGVLVFDSGIKVAIGKVFTGDGLFHFAGGTIAVHGTATSHAYTGLSSGAIVYETATVVFKTAYVAPVKRVKEPVPARPSSQDGAWTDGVSDGAWTEEYVHGAYTQIGYDKEAKPFTRFTQTKEGAPDASYTAEGSGVLVEEGELGILAEPGSLGVRDTYIRALEGKPTWNGSDESTPLGTYTLEAKPTA